MIRLVSVYAEPDAERILYDLLDERTVKQSISHVEMPSFDAHCAFVRSRPYEAWYFILAGKLIVGSTYLTRDREVGLFIFKADQGAGYGGAALTELRRLHPGRLLANINPANDRSAAFFLRHGAKLIQYTYEL